jgi:ribose transport system ATP-binding protein
VSSTPGSVPSVALSLQGVSKRFGSVQALREASIECRAGEIHAVVGENGSGKSTLLGIASGVLAPDAGTIEIAGRPLTKASASEAQRLGLGMAYQTFSEVLDLSVAENLFLAAPVGTRPAFGRMNAWARELLARYDLHIEPHVRMGTLSLAQRQLVEIVKALASSPKVLVLDEPTTALGPGEVETLHALVVEQARQGVAVIYVSHRLLEVLGVAHRVTVLRDGVSQGTFEASGMSEESLVALMIGRPLELAFPERTVPIGTNVLLEVSGLRGDRFGPIDLTLHEGEILGIAGAEGNGQVQLLRSLAGVERSTGTVRCAGAKVDLRSPVGALRAGIVILSGERARESLFMVLGARMNSSIQVLRRFMRLGWISRRRERAAVGELVRRLQLRAVSIEQPVQFLSGGNQQKVAIARPFLRGSVRAILADEPTQGVDVRSRFDIYEALRAKAAEGAALVVKSGDPIELTGLCDRVIVISRGRIVDEIPQEELSERRIIEAIVGVHGTFAAAEDPAAV